MTHVRFFRVASFIAALLVGSCVFPADPWVVIEVPPSYHHTHGGCGNVADWIEDVPGPFGTWNIGCVEISSGKTVPCYTQWHISVSPAGVASLGSLDWWRGGHEYDFDRSNGPRELAIGLLTSDLASGTPLADQWHSEGDTWYRIWSAKYQAPDAAGVVRLHGEYTCLDSSYYMVPSRFWHADPFNPRRVFVEAIVVVGLHKGLVELPSEPYAYLRCGKLSTCTDGADNIDPEHPGAFYGDPAMVSKVKILAEAVPAAWDGLELRLTDMSLPWGSLFDVRDDWHWPHQRHRNGRSLDVSHYLWDYAKRKLLPIGRHRERLLDHAAAYLGMVRYERSSNPRKDKIHYELLPATPAKLCHPVPWGRGVDMSYLN